MNPKDIAEEREKKKKKKRAMLFTNTSFFLISNSSHIWFLSNQMNSCRSLADQTYTNTESWWNNASKQHAASPSQSLIYLTQFLLTLSVELSLHPAFESLLGSQLALQTPKQETWIKHRDEAEEKRKNEREERRSKKETGEWCGVGELGVGGGGWGASVGKKGVVREEKGI